MTLANGLGGFTDEGRTYAIVLDGDQETPLPWANVIANPHFGTIHHRVGIGAHLVGEQPRKPPDAVRQRSGHRSDGEAIFIRDDDTGECLVADAGTDAAALRAAADASFAIPPA